MALEAFANALAQIGQDIGRSGEESRLHARDRAEKQSDISSERAYADQVRADQEAAQGRVSRDQASIAFDARMREIKELEPVRARQALVDAASQFGIDNAESLSTSELFARVQDSRQKANASDVLATAIAQNTAKNSVEDTNRNDPNLVADANKDRENMLSVKAPEIKAAQDDYNASMAQLAALRADDPKLSQVTTLEEQARTKAQEFLASLSQMPPKDRVAALASAASMADISAAPTVPKSKDPAALAAFQSAVSSVLLNNAARWATKTGALTDKDIALQAKSGEAQLRAAGYADHPEIAALLQRINHQAVYLTGLGISPNLPLEQQIPGYKPVNSALAPVAPTAVPAPAPTKPLSAAPVFRAPTNAALAPVQMIDSPMTEAPLPASTSAPSPIAPEVNHPSVPVAGGPSPFPQEASPVTPASKLNWWQSGADNGVPALVDRIKPGVTNAFTPPNSSFGIVPSVAAPAEKWLADNGIALAPDMKAQLISRYTSIISSSLSPEVKAQQVNALKAEALSSHAPAGWFGPH